MRTGARHLDVSARWTKVPAGPRDALRLAANGRTRPRRTWTQDYKEFAVPKAIRMYRTDGPEVMQCEDVAVGEPVDESVVMLP